eukprot:3137217-Rhodomonas_salina.1
MAAVLSSPKLKVAGVARTPHCLRGGPVENAENTGSCCRNDPTRSYFDFKFPPATAASVSPMESGTQLIPANKRAEKAHWQARAESSSTKSWTTSNNISKMEC